MPGASKEYGPHCHLHRPDESLLHGQQRAPLGDSVPAGVPDQVCEPNSPIPRWHDRRGTFRRWSIRALQHLQQHQARACAGSRPLQPVLHLRAKPRHQGPLTGSVPTISVWWLPVWPSPTDSQDKDCEKDCPGSTVCWWLCPHGTKSSSTSLQKPPTSLVSSSASARQRSCFSQHLPQLSTNPPSQLMAPSWRRSTTSNTSAAWSAVSGASTRRSLPGSARPAKLLASWRLTSWASTTSGSPRSSKCTEQSFSPASSRVVRHGPCTGDTWSSQSASKFHICSLQTIKWQDRVSNLQVLDMAKSTSIEGMILKSRLRWVGHAIRMEDNRLPKQLMFGELASRKRKQRRPLKRFKDCVKASICHAEITPKELEPRTHDRTGWRALTRHAMDTFKERRRTQNEEARERRKASADAPDNPGLVPCPHCPRTCKSRIGIHSYLHAHGRQEQRWRASLLISMEYY